MFRYYLVATAIVAIIGGIVFAHRLASPDLKISAQPTGTPTVETRASADLSRAVQAFSGQGSWALSSLPECFEEQSRVRGPVAALAPKVPPAGTRIAPGTSFAVKGCTVIVRAHDVWIERDADRLRVPPEAALYRAGGRLVLVARTGATLEIRRY